MTVAIWIQFGALLVALASLIVQQTRVLCRERQLDQRTANKLKIYYACQTDTGLSEDQIIQQYRRANPLEKVDDVEVRKAIYEMLAEGTLYYLKDKASGLDKYKARRRIRNPDNGKQAEPADSDDKK